ncbi:S8 family serine peptidase [bacterium]|nr:S8 family serine peptidase [bacterium]
MQSNAQKCIRFLSLAFSVLFLFTIIVAPLFGAGYNIKKAEFGKPLETDLPQPAKISKKEHPKTLYKAGIYPAAGLAILKDGNAVDSGDFYRAGGRKIRLFRSLQKVVVWTKGKKQTLKIDAINSLSSKGLLLKEEQSTEFTRILKTEARMTSEELRTVLNDFRKSNQFKRVAPVFINEETGKEMLVTSRIIVKLAEGVSSQQLKDLHQTYDAKVQGHMHGAKDEIILDLGESLAENALNICEMYLKDPRILWASPDFLFQLDLLYTPNDSLYQNGKQWHLDNIGQSGGNLDADIDATEAWNISTGNPNVVIAIIDTGVQLSHPDLSDNIYINQAEDNGTVGVDDDGNGYIDDINGWDFYDSDNYPNPGSAQGHGTCCAGIVAAKGDNAIGVAGIAYNCKILPVKICADDGTFASSVVIGEAIRYAADMADVLSNSWGGGGNDNTIHSAIKYAVDDMKRPVFFASGNSAAGFYKFWLTGFSAGTYTLKWEYSKDSNDDFLEDSIWLDGVVFHEYDGDRLIESFEGDSFPPLGWTTGGDAEWTKSTTHALTGWEGEGSSSAKAGAITSHSTYQIYPEYQSRYQTTYLQTTKTVDAGDLSFCVWLSSEIYYDHFNFYVNEGHYFQASGELDIYTNVIYPARYPKCIAVGASTDYDYRSDYSQYDETLDIVAPSSGGNWGIATTDITSPGGYNNNGDYTNPSEASGFGGTSSATPLAAGVAALLLSKNPNLTADEVRTAMCDTADEIGNVTYTAGFNEYYGYGRLNAYNALNSIEEGENSAPQLIGGNVTPDGGITSATFTYTIHYFDQNGGSPSIKDVYIDGSPYTMNFVDGSGSASNGIYRYQTTLSAGNHTYYFYFTDGSGGSATSPTYSGPLVSEPISIAVTSPNGGETWVAGQDADITWDTEGLDGNVGIEISTDSETSWHNIISSTSNDGSYTWTVKSLSTLLLEDLISEQCKIRVSGISCTDTSDDYFSIVGELHITTTSPLSDCIVNTPYSQILEAEGGDTPFYIWSLLDSDLPLGLTLNSSTGEISGTSTTEGDYSFTVKVADDNDETTKEFLLSCVLNGGEISGRVTLGAIGLEAVIVIIEGSQYSAVTDEDGYYTITGIQLELFRAYLIAEKDGYTFEPPSYEINTTGLPIITGKDFTATFVPPTYTISGNVNLIRGASNVSGVILTLSGDSSDTTNPDAGGDYSFTGLGVGNYTVTASLTGYNFTPELHSYLPLNSNQTQQNFIGTAFYTLTMAVDPTGGGATTPSVGAHTYDAETVVDISATANAGYRFDHWAGGVTNSSSASTTVTIDSNKMVTANFIRLYTITVTAEENGSISPSGDVIIEHGANQTFTITPDDNYHVADVFVDGSSVGAVTGYTFSNVTETHTIQASFAIDTYIITSTAGANGSITPSDNVVIEHGANQTFNITPDDNYHIADVLVDGVSIGAIASYAFSNVTGTHTIQASFAITDSDSDGLPDDWEQQIIDANSNDDIISIENVKPEDDFDNDGLTNLEEHNAGTDPTNTDTDGDGMPDGWEIQYDLKPLVDDADDDADGDGWTNLEEYQNEVAGILSNPNNACPNKPNAVFPDNGDTDIILTPTLRGLGYSDFEGNPHFATYWQILKESVKSANVADTNIVFYYDLENEEKVTIPKSILKAGETYYWRLRYADPYGLSKWSDEAEFTTQNDANDIDGNGILDEQEIDDEVDIDGDRINDNGQDNIASLANVVSGVNTAVKVDIGIIVTQVEIQDADDLPDTNKPQDYNFPDGVYNFRIEGLIPGSRIEVTFYLSETFEVGDKWYKYDEIHGGWWDYTDRIVRGKGTNIVTLEFEDGDSSYGDCDGIANGIIVDPSGPAKLDGSSPGPNCGDGICNGTETCSSCPGDCGTCPTPPSGGESSGSGGGGGGGCFIATASFGTPISNEVKVLSWFRDEYLLTNPVGEVFVTTYYRTSPPIAEFIRQYSVLKKAVRVGLRPIVWLSREIVE